MYTFCPLAGGFLTGGGKIDVRKFLHYGHTRHFLPACPAASWRHHKGESFAQRSRPTGETRPPTARHFLPAGPSASPPSQSERGRHVRDDVVFRPREIPIFCKSTSKFIDSDSISKSRYRKDLVKRSNSSAFVTLRKENFSV